MIRLPIPLFAMMDIATGNRIPESTVIGSDVIKSPTFNSIVFNTIWQQLQIAVFVFKTKFQ